MLLVVEVIPKNGAAIRMTPTVVPWIGHCCLRSYWLEGFLMNSMGKLAIFLWSGLLRLVYHRVPLNWYNEALHVAFSRTLHQ